MIPTTLSATSVKAPQHTLTLTESQAKKAIVLDVCTENTRVILIPGKGVYCLDSNNQAIRLRLIGCDLSDIYYRDDLFASYVYQVVDSEETISVGVDWKKRIFTMTPVMIISPRLWFTWTAEERKVVTAALAETSYRKAPFDYAVVGFKLLGVAFLLAVVLGIVTSLPLLEVERKQVVFKPVNAYVSSEDGIDVQIASGETISYVRAQELIDLRGKTVWIKTGDNFAQRNDFFLDHTGK